jgi:glycosyl-4,4'-diaponeurosporenoate acyltransferase
LRAGLVLVNSAGCAIVQLGVARIFLGLPEGWFGADDRVPGKDSGERGSAELAFYRSVLRIRSWKRRLPDGAGWAGGSFSKRKLASLDDAYLRQFIAETRRGEAAHWAMIFCSPLFFLWNPAWAGAVVTLYMVLSNLPCIAAQRYNRAILTAVLQHRERRS